MRVTGWVLRKSYQTARHVLTGGKPTKPNQPDPAAPQQQQQEQQLGDALRENAEAIRQNRKLMEAILAELSAARREAHTWWRAIFGTRIPPLVFLREMKRSRVKGAKTRRRGRPKS